jgi:hypothetical protein
MKLLNFTLPEDLVSILAEDGIYIDLHNAGLLVGLYYDYAIKTLTLSFDHWGASDHKQNVLLLFKDVSYWQIENHKDFAESNYRTVGMMGFTLTTLPPDSGILAEPDLNHKDIAFVMETQDNDRLVVAAESIRLELS